MRKRLVVAVAAAVVAALTVAGMAIAENTYTVHVASTKPAKPGGTPSKPKPVQVNFGFQVGDTDPTLRGTPIEKYAIGSEGLMAFPKAFPKCSLTNIQSTDHATKCRRAKVGQGIVKNASGSPTDRKLSSSLPCNLRIILYNYGGGMALRLDGDPPTVPNFDSDEIGCVIPVHAVIKGRFKTRKIGGLKSSDYVFTVPQNLLHPGGLDNSQRVSVNKVFKKVARTRIKGKRRKVGFYSSIGCKGNRRTVEVTFTDEDGRVFKARRTGTC
jgi:hypothetical protein